MRYSLMECDFSGCDKTARSDDLEESRGWFQVSFADGFWDFCCVEHMLGWTAELVAVGEAERAKADVEPTTRVLNDPEQPHP